MYSACRDTLLPIVVACALIGCERETRAFAHPAQGHFEPRYEQNALALSEGKRLYAWYNCDGCHAQGGGDKGPALIDDVWLYGSEPADVFKSIAQGRPNGMPAFGSRISEQQMWQIAAYVRSMSGLASPTASPGRSDTIQVKESEQSEARARSTHR